MKTKRPVRYESRVAMLCGVYRPMWKASGERPKAKFVYDDGKGYVIELRCYEQLSIFDETVTLAILHIAGTRGEYLTIEPKSQIGRELRALYDPLGNNSLTAGLLKDVALHEIATVIGIERPSKKDYDAITASLKRLNGVTMTEQTNQYVMNHSNYIVSVIDNVTGRVHIAINHRLAMAAFGEDGFTYALLDLAERQKLGSDIAKAAHRFLVAWMGGGSRTIGLEKLARHVWGYEWDDYSESGKRCQMKKLREAVALEIDKLHDWAASVQGRGSKAKVLVSRVRARVNRNEDTGKPKH